MFFFNFIYLLFYFIQHIKKIRILHVLNFQNAFVFRTDTIRNVIRVQVLRLPLQL